MQALRARGDVVDDGLLAHLSPLAWEHINLTGDYVVAPGRRPPPGQVSAATARAALGLREPPLAYNI